MADYFAYIAVGAQFSSSYRTLCMGGRLEGKLNCC